MEFGWPGYRILLGKIGQLGEIGELDPIKNISLNYAKKGHFHDKNEQFRIKNHCFGYVDLPFGLILTVSLLFKVLKALEKLKIQLDLIGIGDFWGIG